MDKRKVEIYKLKEGDTLSTIAEKFKTSPTEILIKNQLSPKHFFEGNIIFFNKN